MLHVTLNQIEELENMILIALWIDWKNERIAVNVVSSSLKKVVVP